MTIQEFRERKVSYTGDQGCGTEYHCWWRSSQGDKKDRDKRQINRNKRKSFYQQN